MHQEELYSIGDAAHRSGLSVSAVRFYAEAGIIEPTGTSEGGHRLYDIHAIARLELVRTLRELDTGLEEIRRLLQGGTTLHELLTTHLEVVERQEQVLRARQAVLRTLIEQGSTTAQADLMHRLVSMADDERERVVDGFWDEVGRGLDVPEGFVDRLRMMRPRLPQDPTAAQLQAWIELADLLCDQGFSAGVRDYLRDVYSPAPGRFIATDSVQDFIHTDGAEAGARLVALHQAGEPPHSRYSQEAVARFAEVSAALSGSRADAGYRARLAAAFEQAEIFMGQEDGPYQAEEARLARTHGRYLSLVAAINGNAPQEEDPIPYISWLVAALRVEGACV